MKIELRLSTLLSILAVLALATLATCGSVNANNDASSGGTCKWDQGTWDQCTLAP
jgi:hypothetical protein